MKQCIVCLWTEQALWRLFLLGSLALVVVAFVFEYGFGAEPCRMCWWQRYGHWAMVGVGLVGLYMPLSFTFKRALLLVPVLVGGAVAVYQSLGQMGYVELPAFCGGNTDSLSSATDLLKSLQGYVPAPSCSDIGMTVMGLSFAQWNVLVMLGFASAITLTFFIKPKQ